MYKEERRIKVAAIKFSLRELRTRVAHVYNGREREGYIHIGYRSLISRVTR